jgi:hypothetical protein
MTAFGVAGELRQAPLVMLGGATGGLRRQSSRKALPWRKKVVTVAHPGGVDGDREVIDDQWRGSFAARVIDYRGSGSAAQLQPGLGDLHTGEEQSEVRRHDTVNVASRQ